MVVEAMGFQSVTTLPAWIVPQVKTNAVTRHNLLFFIASFSFSKCLGKILLPELYARNHRRNRNGARNFFCYAETTRPWTLKFLKLLSFFWPGQTATRPPWMRSLRASSEQPPGTAADWAGSTSTMFPILT